MKDDRMEKGNDEKEEVQSPSSKSYLWDVFLYFRLSEKTNIKNSKTLIEMLLS